MKKLAVVSIACAVLFASHATAAGRPSSPQTADAFLERVVVATRSADASQTIPDVGAIIGLLPPVARACAQQVIDELTKGQLTPDFPALFDRFDQCMTQKTGLPFPQWIVVLLPALPPGLIPTPAPRTMQAQAAVAPAEPAHTFFRQMRGPGLGGAP